MNVKKMILGVVLAASSLSAHASSIVGGSSLSILQGRSTSTFTVTLSGPSDLSALLQSFQQTLPANSPLQQISSLLGWSKLPSTNIAATPEPSSLLLVGTGLVGCALLLSFRRRNASATL